MKTMQQNNITRELYANKVYGNIGNMDVLALITDQAKTILDVGCGAGDNARILKSLNKYVTGVTISNDEAILAKKVCDEVIVSDIEEDDLELDKKYEVIILSHVCEHLRYPVNVINKLSGFLNKDGIIIIAIPNMAFYKNRFRLLKGDWNMGDSGPFDRTHLHFFSYDSADTLCDGKKVKITKKIPGQLAMPLWPLRRLAPGFCLKIDNIFGKHFPNLFAQQIILVLENIK